MVDIGANWSEANARRIGESVKARRTELGMSAQAVSDRTAELGFHLGRGTIARMETGARGGKFDVSELFILAQALNISPVALLWADAADTRVELLPEVEGTAGSGYEWTVGDRVLDDGTMAEEAAHQSVRLQALRRLMDARRALNRVSQSRHPSRRREATVEVDVAALYDALHRAEDEAAAHGWTVNRNG